MRILVVSDTHGDLQHLESVLSEEDDVDMLLHCGDICGDEDRVRQLVMCAVLGVAGNMDFSGR
ncbi:MAG: metallophosphoesterase family protein, partial [Lachnospiraceae bacterium]|nr:metallophosphoesterase family protein [Lachnospiraceae bacterium]